MNFNDMNKRLADTSSNEQRVRELAEMLLRRGLAMTKESARHLAQSMIETERRVQKTFEERKQGATNYNVARPSSGQRYYNKAEEPVLQTSPKTQSFGFAAAPIGKLHEEYVQAERDAVKKSNGQEIRDRALNPRPVAVQTHYDMPRNSQAAGAEPEESVDGETYVELKPDMLVSEAAEPVPKAAEPEQESSEPEPDSEPDSEPEEATTPESEDDAPAEDESITVDADEKDHPSEEPADEQQAEPEPAEQESSESESSVQEEEGPAPEQEEPSPTDNDADKQELSEPTDAESEPEEAATPKSEDQAPADDESIADNEEEEDRPPEEPENEQQTEPELAGQEPSESESSAQEEEKPAPEPKREDLGKKHGIDLGSIFNVNK